MSKTLLCIDTYSKISDFLHTVWPYYLKAGFDIVGIERTNSPTTWPVPVKVIASGEDAFMTYADLRHTKKKNLLVVRWLDIMDRLVTGDDLKDYDDFCMIEWDLLPLKPFPPLDPSLGLCLNRVGGRPESSLNEAWKSPHLFHMPWWMDREKGSMIVKKGREVLGRGDTENGSFDWMLGIIVHELGLKWQQFNGFSLNKLDSDWAIGEARKAIANEVCSVHGCQNQQQFDALFART